MIATVLGTIALVALVIGAILCTTGYFVKGENEDWYAAGIGLIFIGAIIVSLMAIVWLIGGMFAEMYL